jgi:hypothetical protein
MSLLWIRLKTIANLGFANVVTVILYRMMIKFSVHSVCLIKSGVPEGPFFHESRVPRSGLPSVSTWDDNGRLFSYINVPLGEQPPDWLANPITGDKNKLDLSPWWKISDFEEKTGDVKLIWEQSRMDWVLVFAQRVRKGDEKALRRLNGWLAHWLVSNPPYLGANWKCGQEASIRVIHLCGAALILGQERQSLPGLQQLVRLHLRRISPTIHYAIAQNNNHGTSEAAALFIGGSWLSSLGSLDGKRWEMLGRHWLENRTKKLIEDDGSFSQHSLNYHRMLLDTLSIVEVWRQRLEIGSFSSHFYEKAALATSWLYQMISPISGDGPNIGANDGSCLLQLTDSSYRDYRPSVQLGMALFQDRRAYAKRGLWNLHLTWLGIPEAEGQAPIYVNCDYDDGGYKILRFGDANLVLRYPRFRYRPSQADALHIDLWVSGVNLLQDAGSYSYNSEPDLSGYFFGTMAHNTVQFDDRDQMPKLSRFLFGSWLKTKQLTSISRNSSGVSCSVGYVDFRQAEHVRTVHLRKNSLSVVDEVKGFDKKAVLRWRLPNSTWNIKNISEGVLVSDGDISLAVISDVPILSARLAEGWVSRFYIQKEPIPVLEVEIDREGNFTTDCRWLV